MLNAASDTKFEGSANQPLVWKSVQRLEHPISGPYPEYRCYERGVTNSTLKSVVDVMWDVAGYWKARIPGKTELCDPIGIPGSLAKPDPAGALFYGPARQRIDTQVYAPVVGWPARPKVAFLVNEVMPFSAELAGRSLRLSSGVSFPQSDAGATVWLQSEVQFSGPNTYKYIYSVSQDGRETVQVLWSVLTDREEIRDVLRDYILSAKKTFNLPAGKTIIFMFDSNEPPKWGVGPVVVKDKNGATVATGTASSYGPRTGFIKDVD